MNRIGNFTRWNAALNLFEYSPKRLLSDWKSPFNKLRWPLQRTPVPPAPSIQDEIVMAEARRLERRIRYDLSDLSEIFIRTFFEETGHTEGDKILNRAAKNSSEQVCVPFRKDLIKKLGHPALTNLSYQNREGKVRVYARGDAVADIMDQLAAKTSKTSLSVSNPTITGGAGTGKTVLVKHIAWLFATNQVPEPLQGYQVIQLCLNTLIDKSAKWHGKLERHLNKVFEIIKGGKYICFIDEIHMAKAAGATQDNKSGALDRLKEWLEDKDVIILGATTEREYYQFIGSEPALKRRLREYKLAPLNKDQILSTLQGLYERQLVDPSQEIMISPQSLRRVPPLCEEYLPNSGAPAREIHIVETAIHKMLETQRSADRELVQLREKLQSKRLALKISQWNLSNLGEQIRRTLQDEIFQLEEKVSTWKRKLEEFEHAQQIVEDLRKDLAKNKQVKVKALETVIDHILNRDWSRDPEVVQTYLESRGIDHSLKEKTLYKKRVELAGQFPSIIGEKEIYTALSGVSGVPALGDPEKTRMLIRQVPEVLKSHIVGQDHVVDTISETYKRYRLGYHDRTRPLGVFLFMGPSGVGKTALVQTFNQMISTSPENSLIKIDMGDYSHPRRVLNQLADRLEKRPHSVVLLDEFFKGYPEVYKAFMGVLDSGYLSTEHGKRVCCRQAFFFLTSNAGSDLIFAKDQPTDLSKEIVSQLIARQMAPPEFFGRLDGKLVFNPLSKETVLDIVDRKLNKLSKEYEQRKHIFISYDSAVVQYIADLAYDPKYGAREVTRRIEDKILQLLVNYELAGLLPPAPHIYMKNGRPVII